MNKNVVVIGILFFLLIGVGVYRYSYSDGEQEVKVYQCSDGKDNDGDGFIDYNNGLGDPECKSDTDNYENKLPNVLLFFFVIGLIAIAYLGYNYYKDRKNSNNEGDSVDKFKMQPALGKDRAYELAISNVLNKVKDIPWITVTEKDGYKLKILMNHRDIVETDRFPTYFRTPHLYQISYIMIKVGAYVGCHVLVYCITKGEQHIKNGLDRFEEATNKYNHQLKTRTYKHESPQTESSLMKYSMLDAVRDGDVEGKNDMQDMLKAFGSGTGSSFSDETDDEYQERIRVQQMENKKKKVNVNKRIKAPSGGQQPNNDNDYGGDEE